MYAQGAAVAVSQNLEIATSLCGFHNAERVLLAGHGQVRGIVTGDLQKHAGVRPAFVSLTRGMQESWTKSETGRDFLVISDRMANLLQLSLMRVIPFDIGEQAEIISRPQPIQVGLQVSDQARIAAGALL